jgi:hypothetical protein
MESWGVKYSNCPDTWREVKKRIAENEEYFVSKLEKNGKKTQNAIA